MNKLLLLATRGWTGGKNGTYTGHNNLCFPLINCQLLPQAHLHVLPIVYFFRTLCLGPRWLDTFHVILLTDNWADAAVASEDRLETPTLPPNQQQEKQNSWACGLNGKVTVDSPEPRVLLGDPATNIITSVILSLSHACLSVILFVIFMFQILNISCKDPAWICL